MFAAHAFTALLALAAPFLVLADVTPSEPGPGDSFNAGTTCHVTWEGDKDSTTVWKNMAIELMTGSNLGMVHITTVATNQDGTVNGRFEYPCPEMVPYSAIYFYQFSSPQTAVKTWTTRFTIASPTGATVPPSNPTQPGDNDPIPWGTGALADPSTAVAAPAGGAAPPTGSTPAPGPSTSPSPVVTPPKITTTTSPKSSSTTSTPSATGTPQVDNTTGGALSSVALDARLLLGAASLVFTAFLW